MYAHNASGHGIGCQAVRTPYIYIMTNIQTCARQQKFHHLIFFQSKTFDGIYIFSALRTTKI